MDWDDSVEELLEKFCDEATVRESLHRNSFYYYSKWSTRLQTPVIILSSISSGAQWFSQSLSAEYESILIYATASLSMVSAIIGALSSYLKFSELKKIHESCHTQWQSFYNDIRYQLSLQRAFRAPCEEFVTEVLSRYKHLFEMSPIIRRKFVKNLKQKFKRNNNDFRVPIYCNGMTPTKAWKPDDD